MAGVAAIAVALVGCGLGAGAGSGKVTLEVTDGFGGRALGETAVENAPGAETAMRQLERSHRVVTRYGGRYVQSIDGLAGGTAAGRPIDWFYFVNGSEATVGAADLVLKAGDSVWWDRRDWGAATHVSAVVGQWPQPFASPSGGGRVVEVRCFDPAALSEACGRARSSLESAGATVRKASDRPAGSVAKLRMLIGSWSDLRHDPAVHGFESGPSVSGVYAIPAADGSSIAVLGPDASVRSRIGAGAGFVAATADRSGAVTWVVTGTDVKGVGAAASALSERGLRRRFAVTVNPDGTTGSAPEVPR